MEFPSVTAVVVIPMLPKHRIRMAPNRIHLGMSQKEREMMGASGAAGSMPDAPEKVPDEVPDFLKPHRFASLSFTFSAFNKLLNLVCRSLRVITRVLETCISMASSMGEGVYQTSGRLVTGRCDNRW
jgi:hypothetical protein